jgi:hypothetical protein
MIVAAKHEELLELINSKKIKEQMLLNKKKEIEEDKKTI